MPVDESAGLGSSTVLPRPTSRSKASPEFKDLVMKVLIDNGFDQMRPAKMTQDDFLRLLAAFNAAGIHFS